MSRQQGDDRLQRLDPDRAARGPLVGSPSPDASGPEHEATVLTPRRVQLGAGALAIALVILFTVHQLTSSRGSGTAGIPPGHPLRVFSAPLATTNLVGDANLQPPCAEARHDPRALNVCLLARRGPVVLTFFVPGSSACEQQVSTLGTVARQFAGRGVAFAAVAVQATRQQTASLVRRHRWTVPVAYDRDGAVGEAYGVVVCPLVQLARRGGIVSGRLIGRHWLSPQALSSEVQTLLGS